MRCLALAALLLAGGARATVDHAALLADAPPATLAATGLFGPGGAGDPDKTLIAYAPNSPLFSDYAAKARWIALPPGGRIGWRDAGALNFPVGTVLVKSFGYPMAAGFRTLETRLLVRRASGWVGLPYVWRADGRDADLKKAGARIAVTAVLAGGARAIDYAVPNVNQCKGCHALDGAIAPIGLKGRNLSDAVLNRLAPFTPAMPPRRAIARVAAWDDPRTGGVALRARAYLDANCAHCHNPRGAASNSGLFLQWENADRAALGIGKRPVAAGHASGGLNFDVKPGDPDGSIMAHRMASTEAGVAMPELGRSTVHIEGLALIRQWIASLRD